MTKDISKSVEKKDHKMKMSGKAEYIADMKFADMLYGGIVRSSIAHGMVKEIRLPKLPDGYFCIDASDIPGENHLKVITSEQPVFADQEVKYIGEAIMMLAGPDKKQVEELVKQVEIIYEEKEAVLSLEAATQAAVSYAYH